MVMDAGTERETTSCVLVRRGEAANEDDQDALPVHLRNTLAVLASEATLTRKQWAERARLPLRTLDQHRQILVAGGYAEQVKRGAFKITEKGRTALGTAATATKLHLVHGSQ